MKLTQAAAGSGGSGAASTLIMLMLMFCALYFLLIRPQQKRTRRIAEMQASMDVGDEVVTIGGLYGTIQSVDDDTVMLEIAPEIVARYARSAISRVVVSAADAEAESDDTSDGCDDDAADAPVKSS